MKLASPFQSAAGSNRSVPRSAAAIVSPALTAASGSPAFSAPCAAFGSVTICTAFSVCPSASLNAPLKSACANSSVVSSSTVLLKSDAVGASSTQLTLILAVAAADSASDRSTTLKVNLASPFQFAAGVKASVPRPARAIT